MKLPLFLYHYLTFLVNKSSMLQIKIVVELQRLQLVSLKNISTSIKQNQIAQALYIPFLNSPLLPLEPHGIFRLEWISCPMQGRKNSPSGLVRNAEPFFWPFIQKGSELPETCFEKKSRPGPDFWLIISLQRCTNPLQSNCVTEFISLEKTQTVLVKQYLLQRVSV